MNRSVIGWYELSLDKETNTAELKRYNRPATACDVGEVFVQKITAERFHYLAETFKQFTWLRETEFSKWYDVGVTYPGDEKCFRSGKVMPNV